MRNASLWLFLIPLILACSLVPTPVPSDNGIEGQALMGPMCPVLREGQECPDQPYQATIVVRDSSGGLVVRFETDADGRFRLPLAPGEYLLQPEPPEGMPFPFADEMPVSVQPGAFTRIMVLYDSGIR
jgi:hypothetical protein